MLTPYQFASNSPIANIDLDGLEKSLAIKAKSGEIIYITSSEVIENYRKYLNHGNHVYNWISKDQQYQYMYSANDKFDGIRAGELFLEYNEGGGYHVSFHNYNAQKLEAIKTLSDEAEYKSRKWGIIREGVIDLGIGTVGIVTASFEEVLSGGIATPLVITQIAFSVDEASGGINKILNPRDTYNNIEAKPIKYLIGKYFSDTGENVNNIIDVTLGVKEIPKSEKLIDLVGAYDTMSDAQGALEDYKKQ